jgi:hypothetical protein
MGISLSLLSTTGSMECCYATDNILSFYVLHFVMSPLIIHMYLRRSGDQGCTLFFNLCGFDQEMSRLQRIVLMNCDQEGLQNAAL